MISYKDFVVGAVVGAVLVALNIYFMIPSGLATYYSYDPVGIMPIAIDLSRNLHRLLLAPVTFGSGVPLMLHGIILRIFGDGYWQYNAMMFWQTALLVSLASWIGRRYAGFWGAFCLVLATALLPPLSFTVIDAARSAFYEIGIPDVIWPSPPSEGLWGSWKTMLKTDCLAGAFLAWAVALIVIDAKQVGRTRFLASGAFLALAILSKSYFMPAYLFLWAVALFTCAILLRNAGARYLLASYWALVVLVPCFALWSTQGAANDAFAYIQSSFTNIWYKSAEYQKPQFGHLYFFYVAPTAIGLGAQVMLVSVALSLMVSSKKQRWLAWEAVPVFVAGCALAGLFTASMQGKNFPNTLPIFWTIWLGLLIIGARSIEVLIVQWRRLVLLVWLVPLGLTATIGLGAAVWQRPVSVAPDIVADRNALTDLVATVLANLKPRPVLEPRTALWPCIFGGIPAILNYETFRQARRMHVAPADVFTNIYWDEKSLLTDPKVQQKARQQVLAFDVVISVPGGAHEFPPLGALGPYVCDFVDDMVTRKGSPFRLVKTIKISPTNSQWVYFMSGDHVMDLNVYVNDAVR